MYFDCDIFTHMMEIDFLIVSENRGIGKNVPHGSQVRCHAIELNPRLHNQENLSFEVGLW